MHHQAAKRMSTIFALLRLGILLGTIGIVSRQTAAQWKWESTPGKRIGLVKDGSTLWAFHYGSDTDKPFFDPLALPGRENLAWNQPPDHPWHHGLWFSWKYLNHVNYWEFNRKSKRPDGQTRWTNVQINTRDDHSATIRMDVSYVAPDQQVVLRERRRIDVAPPQADGQFHLDWHSEFTAGEQDVVLDRTPLPGEPGGQAWGGYAGLSLRLTQKWDDRQAIAIDGPVTFNASSRFRGKSQALDYQGTLPSGPCGIAIIDHPSNLNHPSPWYVIRTNVMSYFTPAVICYGPHTLARHQKFALRYRVIVHPDRWDAARLKAEYQRFAEQDQ